MAQTPQPLIGRVLVTGGCGFLGYALVRQLLDDPCCGSVHVLDRVTNRNRHDGAKYVEGSITDRALVEQLLAEIKPTVVFHLASPNFSLPVGGRADFFASNVDGTKILLESSARYPSVKAFVNASTVDIYAGAPHRNVDETQPTCASLPHASYAQSKAISDELVLAANGPELRTVSLRLAHMYGSRCTQQLPLLVDMSEGKGPLFRIGSGANMIEVLYVENAAAAHVVAAKALVDPSLATGKIDGEAFNISDGKPLLFWYHTCVFWSAVRGHSVTNDLYVIPEWLARFVFGAVHWGIWIATLGYQEPPPSMSSTAISYAVEDHTYSSQKAKERLKFEPDSQHDEVVRQAVQEELQRRSALKATK
ncbi:C-3 sterol dehydrogenase/C-4 decarboxylase [Thozetella sp. PMI_491]|nr:C-3 sterol dehydrogenase/C-4 decarboxylase [Thozetella sp. PMI_491]